MSNRDYYKVFVNDVGIPKILQDEPFVASKERGLIRALKETMQSPLLRPFEKDHITWLLHVTFRHGLYKHIEIAVIPWDQLEDFVQGEQKNPKFPCKFTRTKEHKLCNPSNTLTHPRTNSMSLVIVEHLIYVNICLQFCFDLTFQCVSFWFFNFGIINHIAILAMLVVTL
jgi:hypothetical protein